MVSAIFFKIRVLPPTPNNNTAFVYSRPLLRRYINDPNLANELRQVIGDPQFAFTCIIKFNFAYLVCRDINDESMR
jgi:hypothetical protein